MLRICGAEGVLETCGFVFITHTFVSRSLWRPRVGIIINTASNAVLGPYTNPNLRELKQFSSWSHALHTHILRRLMDAWSRVQLVAFNFCLFYSFPRRRSVKRNLSMSVRAISDFIRLLTYRRGVNGCSTIKTWLQTGFGEPSLWKNIHSHL